MPAMASLVKINKVKIFLLNIRLKIIDKYPSLFFEMHECKQLDLSHFLDKIKLKSQYIAQ